MNNMKIRASQGICFPFQGEPLCLSCEIDFDLYLLNVLLLILKYESCFEASLCIWMVKFISTCISQIWTAKLEHVFFSQQHFVFEWWNFISSCSWLNFDSSSRHAYPFASIICFWIVKLVSTCIFFNFDCSSWSTCPFQSKPLDWIVNLIYNCFFSLFDYKSWNAVLFKANLSIFGL